MVPRLNLPQAVSFVFVEVFARTDEGQHVLVRDKRPLRGEFFFGADVVDAGKASLGQGAIPYSWLLLKLFWRPSPEHGRRYPPPPP